MATIALRAQDFFSTTLSAGITASDTTISLNALPTGNEGYLVLEPDSSGQREIIYYTSKTSSAVVCPSVGAGRGVGGTTAKSHPINSTVKMNMTAEHFEALRDGTSLAWRGADNRIATSETTTSTSYTDLATSGPAVTVTVGSNGILLVLWGAAMINSASGNFTRMSWAASGANTIAAGTHEAYMKSESGAGDLTVFRHVVLTDLTPGSTTLTGKYIVSGGTGTFLNRELSAIPF